MALPKDFKFSDIPAFRSLHKGKVSNLRDGSPAIIWYFPEGTVMRTENFRDGVLNDFDDGRPSTVHYYQDGSVARIEHFRDGHSEDRPDGSPAIVWYLESGEIDRGFTRASGSSKRQALSLVKRKML